MGDTRDYTDRIGTKCQEFFLAVGDCEGRADFAACALDVGAKHNRYFVLGIAGALIEAVIDPADEVALADRLSSLSPGTLDAGAAYLKVHRLRPMLRPYFSQSESE